MLSLTAFSLLSAIHTHTHTHIHIHTYSILTPWHYLFLRNRFLVGVVCNISHVDGGSYCSCQFTTRTLSQGMRVSTCNCFPLWRFDPIPGRGLPLRGFAFTLIWHTTLGRTPLDKWSARRSDVYLTSHNTQQTSTSPTVFEPTIPAIERLQTYTVDRASTRTGTHNTLIFRNSSQGRKVEPRTAKYILSYDLCYRYVGGVVIQFNDDVLRNIALVSTQVSTKRSRLFWQFSSGSPDKFWANTVS